MHLRSLLHCSLALAATAGLWAADPVKAAQGSLFNPSDFASLGKLQVRSGDALTFDTGSGQSAPTLSGKVTATGALGVSQGGGTTVAVFAFDEIDLGDGAQVRITGQRPIVLLSRKGINVTTPLSVSGTDATTAAVPSPAPGATAPGTAKPADPALADLSGGSAGAPGVDAAGKPVAAGGGGGGAIGLIALGTISISGRGGILADGGRGGDGRTAGSGGNGGSILIAAPVVQFRNGGRASARGGAGASGGPGVAAEAAKGAARTAASGNGGHGGRIALYVPEDLVAPKTTPGKNQVESPLIPYYQVDIDGGDSGLGAADGEMGTLYDGTWPALK